MISCCCDTDTAGEMNDVAPWLNAAAEDEMPPHTKRQLTNGTKGDFIMEEMIQTSSSSLTVTDK